MLIPPGIDLKIFLVCLICDAISDLGSKHHLVAVHEVVHDIFESWYKCDGVDKVEVNFFVGGNLDSLISFDEVDESAVLKRMIIRPLLAPKIFDIDLFEE